MAHHSSYPSPILQAPIFQAPYYGPQSLSDPGRYYTRPPNNVQWSPNIDPSLMSPQGIAPATMDYPLGQSSLDPRGLPLNPSAHASNPKVVPPQSHGHQGPYLPNPRPLGDQPRQYGDTQSTSHMGQVAYPTQYDQTQTGVVWQDVPADYRHSGDMRPSGDQQNPRHHSKFQGTRDANWR